MRRPVFFLLLFFVYSSFLDAQKTDMDDEEEDMMYKQLSPSAFFAMKDNVASMGPMGPMGQGMGSMGQGMGPMGQGMGPMGQGMGPMGQGMGSMGQGMGPMGPGMGSMGKGMDPMGLGMGSMGQGMGPMGPGLGPKGKGMGPMGPGMGPMSQGIGSMGPKGQGMGPMDLNMGQMGQNLGSLGPMGPGMGPKGQGIGPSGPNMGPMTPGTTDTRDGKKGYEHFDLSILDGMARSDDGTEAVENFALDTLPSSHHNVLMKLIFNLCFCLTYIWRRGRQSIRKYYHLRDIYQNHLAFEVGYIAHVITAKYQNMLELYQYCRAKVFARDKRKRPKKNMITRMHLTHFQHSLVQDSQQIEHLCNMLNELKAKYALRPYDPRNKFDIPPEGWDKTTTPETKTKNPDQSDENLKRIGKTRKAKGYIAKQVEEAHKLIGEAAERRKKKLRNAREYYKKYGHLPSTTERNTQQPMRLWSPNLDYGWSGEDGDDW